MPLLGLPGMGPFFRKVNVDEKTRRTYGGPYVHKDLCCSKLTTKKGEQQRKGWYSPAAGNVMQSLTGKWFADRLYELFKWSPIEEFRHSTPHVFRKTLLRLVARCWASEVDGELTGAWVPGSVSSKKFYYQFGKEDQLKYANDPSPFHYYH